MDDMLCETLVETAKKTLREKPFDSVHDERHHSAVWENCQQIIKNEGLAGVDENCLKIAAWWHDVQRGQEDENALLKAEMQKLKIDKGTQQKVLEIAGSHSFGNNQHSTEAKILFDADKLEYVSVERVLILLESYKKGEVDKTRFDYYVQKWRERILAVREQIHFKSVKEEFEKRLKELVAESNKNPDLKGFADDIMI